ncbi:class I SAM-dependent RNA methyltransferase [Rhodococcus sp. NPDC056743]|uniref:class I SAM-dependent RNA methyltransferase n=1 Tax=Rhodococcus sp. NPDC056743 TaxID=3345934 RepID=UPI00366F0673
MSENWTGQSFEAELGKPGHGGFVVARHEGRVVFVRHGLPGERALVRVTEDKGGSFARADAVSILEASPHRIDPTCPVAGPGGAGCCDYSHADLEIQREMKSLVVAEQLQRLAGVEHDVPVEVLPGTGDGTGWRTRVRLAVDGNGEAGYHAFRSNRIVTDLRCTQIEERAYDGLAGPQWSPGSELQVVLDGAGARHVVEISAPTIAKAGRRATGRRGATARRAAGSGPRKTRVALGSDTARERVGTREWELSVTGFWQAHRGAAQAYSDVVRDWAGVGAGDTAWDLYGGVGVFAAVLADRVGPDGVVESVELSARATSDGRAALADQEQVRFHTDRVEKIVAAASLAPSPGVVVLDPPRAGAGRPVVEAIASTGTERVIHIGCDPASFGRDVGLYLEQGFRIGGLRAFDAFPQTHHVECIALLER